MSPALLLRLRLWTLLLLAAIGLQAASPMRMPLERMNGSAFSAATIDVALASPRKIANGVATAPITPPLPLAPMQVRAPLLRTLALGDRLRLRPEARGPPPRERPSRTPDTTAPPLA